MRTEVQVGALRTGVGERTLAQMRRRQIAAGGDNIVFMAVGVRSTIVALAQRRERRLNSGTGQVREGLLTGRIRQISVGEGTANTAA